MKNLLLCALLVVSATSIATADEIAVQSAGVTNIVTVGTGSSTSYSNADFNGWDILFAFGSNNVPGLSPSGLDLSVQATCSSGACLTTPLDVFYTATGFSTSVPAGGFETTYSSTQTGAGTTRAVTWADSTNSLFGGGLPVGVGTDHLGTVGTFSSPGGFGTASGGPAEVSPYSLTIEEVFTAGSSGTSSFSADGDITAAVPEPSSLALLASGLLFVLFVKWRPRPFIG